MANGTAGESEHLVAAPKRRFEFRLGQKFLAAQTHGRTLDAWPPANAKGSRLDVIFLTVVALRTHFGAANLLKELKVLLASENRQTRTCHSRYYFLHTPDAF